MGRFQYTGQIWLSELGMYHYKARIYSPTLICPQQYQGRADVASAIIRISWSSSSSNPKGQAPI